MNITVIGAGQMGSGIAQVCAANGHRVTVVDISSEALEKGLGGIRHSLGRLLKKERITQQDLDAALDRITTDTDLGGGVAGAEVIIEAATENLELKQRIFREIDTHAPQGAILATNTSSISITRLAAVTSRPEAVIGMHFMNPVPIMQLVEVIRGHATSDTTLDRTIQLAEQLGKTPIAVNDYPGFIANRILMPMINEAVYALWEGVAEAEAIDGIMKLGMAHPMGPLQLADYIGLDTCRAILDVMYEGYRRPQYVACPLLVNMVRAGKLGVKSGEGFYRY